MLKAAGYEEAAVHHRRFPEAVPGAEVERHAGRLRARNAVGDANAWTHWALWAFGGRLADEDNHVAINSKETAAALEYARALYQTFIPGTLSWLDPNNNKAFLAGDISLTLNGVSVYYVVMTSKEEAVRKLAADIQHVNMPVGPSRENRPSSIRSRAMFLSNIRSIRIAAKEYMRFMMEREQYEAWQSASLVTCNSLSRLTARRNSGKTIRNCCLTATSRR